MKHEPFQIKPIKSDLKFNSSPSSLFIYLDQIYLGFSDGSLSIYSILDDIKSNQTKSQSQSQSDQIDPITPSSSSDHQNLSGSKTLDSIHSDLSLSLSKTIVNFSSSKTASSNSPSSIDGLSVIKEINSLVTLSAGNISLYDLNTLELQSSCEKWTKFQASTFTLETSILRQDNQGIILDIDLINPQNSSLSLSFDSQSNQLAIPNLKSNINSKSSNQVNLTSCPSDNNPKQSDDVPVLITLLAVPCKRRLILFGWKDGEWLSPNEISLPHQARSLAFMTPLKLILGYSTGGYATVAITLTSSNAQTFINYQLSEPFSSPISSNLINRISDNHNNTINSSTISSHSTSLVSGLSNLTFRKSGLVSLALSGSSKLSKNPVIKVGPPTNEVIGIKDQIVTFFNHNGNYSRTHPNPNSPIGIPSTIIYDTQPSETIVQSPYLLSLFPATTSATSHLIIHSIPTLSFIQSIQFQPFAPSQPETKKNTVVSPSKPLAESSSNSKFSSRRLLTSSSNAFGLTFLVLSEWNSSGNVMQHQLECLQMKPWDNQIDQLIEKGEYVEALALIESLDKRNLPNKAILSKRLNGLCAVVNFCNNKFDLAIDTFISLAINPAKVIALYPHQISGKLFKPREQWEELFGGRSTESYLKMSLDVGIIMTSVTHDSNRPASELGSKPSSLTHIKPSIDPNGSLLDDDRGSIRSGQSTGFLPVKVKPSEISIQKPKTEVISQDSQYFFSINVLIRYLTDRRQNVNKAFAQHKETENLSSRLAANEMLTNLKFGALWPSEKLLDFDDQPITEIKNVENLVQVAKIIDTALFKCYLAIKPTMLGPLCRLPNWCEVEEVESLLMNAKKYHELLDLYHGKNQHDKALKLLKKMGESEDEAEDQISPTIRYLQKLGPLHLDLILNTSQWVFSRCSNSMAMIQASLEIFVADMSTVESLPRLSVMSFLEKENPLACRLYLEHLINDMKEKTVTFHEKLIHLYIIEFKRLRTLGSLDEANEIYQRLLNHLTESDFYSSNWVLGRLPQDDMFEARALTLGNMGQHDAALSIYVHRLGNLVTAEEYCKRIYSKTLNTDGSIFVILLKIYLRPMPNMTMKGYHFITSTLTPLDGGGTTRGAQLSSSDLLDAALKLISDHGNKISNIAEVLDLLPSLISLEKLQVFVLKSFRRLKATRKELMILKECSQSRLDEVELGLKVMEDRAVKIDDKRLCVSCGKRLGNSVIAVHPPYGEVTHYQCRERFSKNQA
ncbi:hypothetical protein O181_008701 [Austropuccinia psidii MF-1]|uniref:CNH domain-containing protein n=1 Tax=Austropuccinia psidii MF-1 TaxID=1389203 RepID=A0A9Q3GIS3_9BASI|nr:hypothetical protein [Austropuccinia psidii MF-1]